MKQSENAREVERRGESRTSRRSDKNEKDRCGAVKQKKNSVSETGEKRKRERTSKPTRGKAGAGVREKTKLSSWRRKNFLHFSVATKTQKEECIGFE